MYELRRLVLVGSPSERRHLIMSYLQAWQPSDPPAVKVMRICTVAYALPRATCSDSAVYVQTVADDLVAKHVDAAHSPRGDDNNKARWRVADLDAELQ